MDIDPRTFDAQILTIVKEKIKMTADKAQEIGRRIGIDMQANIIAGEAKPILARSTINAKKRKGSPQPTTPLYDSGEYAARFTGEMTSEGGVWIYNRSHVKPRWPRIFQRTLSVVKPEVVKEVVRSVLIANR